MSGEELARKAYEAYGTYTGGKSFQGGEMPAWPDLPAATRGAWAAAVRSVVAEVQK